MNNNVVKEITDNFGDKVLLSECDLCDGTNNVCNTRWIDDRKATQSECLDCGYFHSKGSPVWKDLPNNLYEGFYPESVVNNIRMEDYGLEPVYDFVPNNRIIQKKKDITLNYKGTWLDTIIGNVEEDFEG